MEENVAVLGIKMTGMFIYRDTNAIAHTHTYMHAHTNIHTHTYIVMFTRLCRYIRNFVSGIVISGLDFKSLCAGPIFCSLGLDCCGNLQK